MVVLMGDGGHPTDLDGRIFFTIVNGYLVTIYLYKFENYQIHYIGGASGPLQPLYMYSSTKFTDLAKISFLRETILLLNLVRRSTMSEESVYSY